MPFKPDTILNKVKTLPEHQSKPYLDFKDWLRDEEDNAERNCINYLKVLLLFSGHVGCEKHLEDVTREDVVSFLDKRKKVLR